MFRDLNVINISFPVKITFLSTYFVTTVHSVYYVYHLRLKGCLDGSKKKTFEQK
jgi:hypothetical protein